MDKDKHAYIRIVTIARELGIIKNDYLTDEQLALLIKELLEYLGIAPEKL